jgi:hypothetical protein
LDKKQKLQQAFSDGEGILRLSPTWVPRTFSVPGRRLKLHPQDLYAFGKDRGGICERWIASTVKADNGPDTTEYEGLSAVVVGAGEDQVLFKDAIELMGDELLGPEVMVKHGGWAVLAKLFDNKGPLPHHVHLDDEAAARVGQLGKPEAYYFPAQLNTTEGDFPFTFFGLLPGTTKEDVLRCLERFDRGDNGILELSQAYKLVPGSGWLIPAGILHAPGSLVTYEPQRASDVMSVFQSVVQGSAMPRHLLEKDVPAEKQGDMEYLLSLLDWEANVDPYFAKNRRLEPKPVKDVTEMQEAGYMEKWITYGSQDFSAKELTVFPGKTVTITDEAAYGAIIVQGTGRVGKLYVEAPTLIRFGAMTNDEIFVAVQAAKEGVKISNLSDKEDLVLLKHFGPSV